jgi:YidC/Oxa1 family membrane protein insertase
MNEMLVALLTSLSHSFGGSPGCAIIVFSLGIRVALLPLTIRLARRARRNQEMMRKLQPEIERLKARFEKNPEKLFEEMGKLYRKHDCNPFDLPTLAGSLIQLPIFGMVYAAIRSSLVSGSAFLWIRNLAAPNLWLTVIILAVTGLSAGLMSSASGSTRYVLVAVQMIITFLIVWKLAAGLALYWASSSLVGLSQTLWIRRSSNATSRPA